MGKSETAFMKKMGGLIGKITWLISELIKTFSNQPGFFSSKRLERFIMFNIAMWIIVGYTIRNWYNLTTTDVSILTGILLVGGAWNHSQIRKDMKEIPNGGGSAINTGVNQESSDKNGAN